MQRIPSISALSGNNLNMTFDIDGCYEASGNLYADLDRKGLLNQAVTTKMEVILGCKDNKLIGDFFSTPNQDVLKGNFTVDNELNYVLVANSALVLSKISKLFNVSVETIRQDNDNLDIIRPGQILKITIKAF